MATTRSAKGEAPTVREPSQPPRPESETDGFGLRARLAIRRAAENGQETGGHGGRHLSRRDWFVRTSRTCRQIRSKLARDCVRRGRFKATRSLGSSVRFEAGKEQIGPSHCFGAFATFGYRQGVGSKDRPATARGNTELAPLEASGCASNGQDGDAFDTKLEQSQTLRNRS